MHQAVGIGIDIPHKLGEHIGPQLAEVHAPEAGDLFKQHRGMVLLEQFHIGLQYMEVWERGNQVVKVDAVVPNEDIVRYLPPPRQGTKPSPLQVFATPAPQPILLPPSPPSWKAPVRLVH